MTEPPVHVVRRIETFAALKRACTKVARGAAVYSPTTREIYGIGVNGPPSPLECGRSGACEKICGKVAEHAEARALWSAYRTLGPLAAAEPVGTASGVLLGMGLQLVHVKLGDQNRIVGSRGPRCVECARLILETKIVTHVWLHELMLVPDTSPELAGSGVLVESTRWHSYTPLEFFRRSCVARGIHL